MKDNKFPLILLCALLTAFNTFNDSLFLRIAIAADALVVLFGIIKRLVVLAHGKAEN